jgi:hypothetical protein
MFGLVFESVVPTIFGSSSLLQRLFDRGMADPFSFISMLVFLLSLVHTFSTPVIQKLAKKIVEREGRTLKYSIVHLLGEVELCFLLWCIPLMVIMSFHHGFFQSYDYLATRNFTEAAFVGVVMVLAATRPIIQYGEKILNLLARFGRFTPGAWWFTILSIGPLLGSLITEPAAITLCALLLIKHFFSYRPSVALSYATFGLLLTNISVGGVMTHFAAPPVVIVAKAWDLTTPFMLQNYGWKVVIGLFVSTSLYYWVFRKEFVELSLRKKEIPEEEHGGSPVPIWLTILHVAILGLIVYWAHYPEKFLPVFALFVLIHTLTQRYQSKMSYRPAILVGLFFAGLIIQGGFQGWWIEIVLQDLERLPLMLTAIFLTSFNDNAAITYLASLTPSLSMDTRYVLLAGAVTGGGLTVIANAPNPAGQALLQPHFKEGIDPIKLLISAATATVIFGSLFYWL